MKIDYEQELYEKKLDDSYNMSIRGDFRSAEEILRNLDQNDPRVRFNLGWFDMRKGYLSKGYDGLDFGRMLGAFGSKKITTSKMYDCEFDLNKKTLLFYGEGGLGDEIMNIRFCKNFYDMGAKIILGCSPSLYPIFEKIKYISAMVNRDICSHVFHDYWVPAMSAPKYLKLEYETLSGVPYLNLFEPRKIRTKNNKIKVGIKWSGNPKFEHQQHRRFPVEKILNLTEIEGITYYSLQRDDDLVDNLPCIDLRYELKTWKDTAEIIAGLDLIITSCTSIAHLSASMGKPTWVIVPILPYYPWALPSHISPWYDSIRIYRQVEYGNWDVPFNKIKKDIQNLQIVT